MAPTFQAALDWDGKCMNCGEDELEGGSDGGKCTYCGSITIPPQLGRLNQSAPPSLKASVEAEPLVTAHGGADTGDNAAPWGNSPREIQKRAMAACTAAIPNNVVDIWARELRKVMAMDDLKAACRKIRQAIPGARFNWYDYECSVSVAHPTINKAFVIYQAPRSDSGQPEIVGDVDKIIAELGAL